MKTALWFARVFAGSLLASCLLLQSGCGDKPAAPSAIVPSSPVASSAMPPAGTAHFMDVAATAGINYEWTVTGKRPLNILQTIGNGCAFLDYDGDGNLDILLVGPKLALYKGDGKGHFTDVTHEAGLDKLSGHFLGCAVGDYDNDGFEDVYISGYRTGLLLHNEGGKSFRDVTAQAGIKPQPWATSCSFGDVDGDGRLDLYICNYSVFGPDTKPQLCDFSGVKSSCGPRYYFPEKSAFYYNEGGGKFRDATQQWGLTLNDPGDMGASLPSNRPGPAPSAVPPPHKPKSTSLDGISGKGLGVAMADFDDSGRQSIAIANDEMPGDLMHNLGKRFKNIGAASATAYDDSGSVHGGMGIDWGDYNNDGKLDLVVATFQHEAKCVYRNQGQTLFVDDSAPLGIFDKSAPYVAFGVKFLDFDNDGWLDMVFANGHVEDNVADIDKSATYRETTQLYRNNTGKSFADISSVAGDPFQKPIVGRGLAIGDFDNDGRMDILVVDSEGKPMLLHNETPQVGHWLSIRLQGVKSNRDGIGALITVEAEGRKMLRRCATDGSYLSASDRRVHFGLGKDAKAAAITVRWPSGKTDTYKNIPGDRVITLKEGSLAPLP